MKFSRLNRNSGAQHKLKAYAWSRNTMSGLSTFGTFLPGTKLATVNPSQGNVPGNEPENYLMKSNVSKNEIEAMGRLLQRQYGTKAMTMAKLMTNQHLAADDTSRAEMWAAVQKFLTGTRSTPTTIH